MRTLSKISFDKSRPLRDAEQPFARHSRYGRPGRGAVDRERWKVAFCKVAAPYDRHRAVWSVAHETAAHFFADQQTREEIRNLVRLEMVEQHLRAGRKQLAQDRSIHPGDFDPLAEGRRAGGALGDQPSQDRVVQQHGVEFTGHEGFKAGDLAIRGMDPLAVGSRQHDQGVRLVAVREIADHLGFLAAHDIGQTVGRIGSRAGDEVDHPPPRANMAPEFARERPLPDWERGIGRFDPSGPAGDHARSDHRRVGACGKPAAQECLESVLEGSVLDGEDARRGLNFVQHIAIPGYPPGSEGGCPPVDRDQGRLWHRSDPAEFRQKVFDRLALLHPCTRLFFALGLLGGETDNLLGAGERDHDDTHQVRHDEIAGIDDHAAAGDRDVDRKLLLAARKHRVRATRRDGAGPDRPADIFKLVGVAASTVDDHAADAAVLGKAAHQPAADGCVRVAPGIDDDDIAGLRHFQRLQRIDEIAFGQLHRHRLPGDLGAEGRLDRVVHDAGAILDIGKHCGCGIAGQDLVELRKQVGATVEIIELFEHFWSSGCQA